MEAPRGTRCSLSGKTAGRQLLIGRPDSTQVVWDLAVGRARAAWLVGQATWVLRRGLVIG